MARFEEAIGLRDSKAPDAGHIILPADAFARFVRHVKQGHLDT
jgi:hypothetical protein